MPHCSALRVTYYDRQCDPGERARAHLWIILAPCRFSLKLSGGSTARYHLRA
uniref:Uncharacterized protein n=1 Tax=Arundo donax TaxID=35708 RepID=A0A0A9H157_ARUDO